MTAAAPQHPLAARVVTGDVRALARVCRLVDDGAGAYRELLKQLFPYSGRAWTLGVTGMPGAGKSTLTDKLIAGLRAQGKRVGVVAIDPTSPFSGGAILGDRIRMQRHYADENVFIRSLATRGALGGLSRSAADVVRVVDAWGADVVIVETVGVGQDELEVTRTVDTTLVVMAPGMGDEVQALKAGILECADVFAVNKADREGADITTRDLELMVMMGMTGAPAAKAKGHGSHHAAPAKNDGIAGVDAHGRWQPPIIKCVATKAIGVDELLERMADHHSWLTTTELGKARRLRRSREAMHNQLRNTLVEAAEAQMAAEIDAATEQVAKREIDPYTAAEELLARFRAGSGHDTKE
jgi:LAO/AO transport system kinase